MEIRVTLVDPRRVDAQVDVAIDAPAGTPLAAVSDHLLAALGITDRGPRTPEPRFRCDRRPLEPTQPLGLPPLLQGAVLTVSPGPATTAPDRPTALLEAHVTAGPDAGATVPLPIGRHTIGRGAGNLIQLTDPDASRVHAELTVDATGIELRDAHSTNGICLRGERLGANSKIVRFEDEIRVGSGVIAVRQPDRPPAVATPDAAGHLRINRRPVLRPPRPDVEISFPGAPPDRSATRIPWPTLLLPLLLAVPLAVIWKQPAMLLFALLTPLMMGGQYLVDRRTGRREAAERQARHELITARREQELELAVSKDAARLHATRPDLARLAVTVTTPTDELWSRSLTDDDFLTLRLGRGPESSQVKVLRPEPDDPETGRRPERFIHPDIPVAVDLGAVGVLGVCGPREPLLGLSRSLIGQIAVLHSPHDVRIEVLHADPEQQRDWRWTHWLPHYDRSAVAFPTTVECSPLDRSGHPTTDDRSRRVIVLDGAHRLRRRPELAALLSRAAEVRGTGVADTERIAFVLCLDRVEQALPVECGATVTLDSERPTRGVLQRKGSAPAPFVPDLASERWSERVARRMAPLRDATPVPEQDLPSALRLTDLLADADQVRPADPDELVRHWRRTADSSPSATIGRTASGPFRIDLRRDGPHVLVGGTTGAGKSELLQTLIVALAVGSSPDTMSFLLVDYKGGAAFRECAALPHVGGVITDLDPAQARRALASLTAELRRRERILHSAEAADIDGYHLARVARPQLPTLPRLVVIVDEFRVLAEELPDFINGLVRTATVGRSLGVHLVLATQRPTGIVSADISANVNLRIALRVRDGADSRDLIDDPGAARLPLDRPGRALARIAAGPLTAFQTARVSGPGADQDAQVPSVRRLDHAETPSRAEPVSAVSSDLRQIVQAATSATAQMNLLAVQQIWLPPLPSDLQLDQVLGPDCLDGRRPRSDAGSPTALPFALLDLPAEQRQEALTWRLDGTHLAIAGGPRSGRSTTLHTIARVAETVSSQRELHLYAIDGAGALTGLNSLHRVEAVIAVHDSERSERLLRLLSDEINARQEGGPPISGSETAAASLRPDIVLLIDGWEALVSTWSGVDHGRPIDQLTAILRDGTAVGVYAAIAGGRTLLTGAVGALVTERVVLRFADPADAVLAGVPTSQLSRSQPPGRGLFLGPRFAEAVELQVARHDPAGSSVGRTLGGRRSRRPVRPPASRQSWQLPELPRRLEYSQLREAWRTYLTSSGLASDPGRLRVPIGIGADQALPVVLDLTAAPITLVVGPAGSGRTSALHCIADGLRQAGVPPLWVSLNGDSRRNHTGARTPVSDRPTGTLSARHASSDVHPLSSGVHPLSSDVHALSSDVHPLSSDVHALNPDAQLPPAPTFEAQLSPSVADHAFPVPLVRAGLQLTHSAVTNGRAPGLNDDESYVNGLTPQPNPVTITDSSFIDGGAPAASAALAAALSTRATAPVLVDDTLSTGMPGRSQDELADLLMAHIGSAPMVIATSGAELLGAYRGLLSIAKTARSGLLLSPGAPGEAEVFGLRPSHRPPGPPGRALLVHGGRTTTVQLALSSWTDHQRSGEKLDP